MTIWLHSMETVLTDRFYAISHQGLVRSSNQDHTLADDSLGLWAVADGMGGHRAGDLASRLACKALHDSVKSGLGLVESFEHAHAHVRLAQQKYPSAYDMGTTLVAALETEDGFDLAWVGDSRAYLFSPNGDHWPKGQLQLLSSDQNVASRLFERGEITAEQARYHPHRNVLTDCIGQREGAPRIEFRTIRWKPGVRLLLCSDGLSGEVTEADLLEVMASDRSLERIGKRLINQALDAGGGDNIAVLIVESQ